MNQSVWKVFRFCPRCGHPLKLVTTADGQSLRCSKDNSVFYQNPHSAVSVAIMNDAKQMLFIRREVDPRKGDWDLPGGFVNWGESPETAIVREIQEELSVPLTITRVLGTAHDWYPFNGLDVSVNTTIFQGTIEGAIKPNEEIQSLHWLNQSELPTDHISFDSVRKAIEHLKS